MSLQLGLYCLLLVNSPKIKTNGKLQLAFLRLEIVLRMFAANICHFGTSGFSFVEYLVNGCRYFPNILYLDTY